MNSANTIIAALAHMLDGEPAPGFRTAEFDQLVAAALAIDRGAPGDDFHTLGTRTLHLLMARVQSSMCAEREVALMRDIGKSIC
jgi:hypothetical protein